MHLVARAAYRNGAYMYRKDDVPRQSSILLSQNEFNSPEELKHVPNYVNNEEKNCIIKNQKLNK